MTTDPLLDAASVAGDAVAVRTVTTDWTYAELNDWVDRWSGQLSSQNVGAGDRIAVIPANDVGSIATIWSVLRSQATCCCVSPRWSTLQRATALQQVQPLYVLDPKRHRLTPHDDLLDAQTTHDPRTRRWKHTESLATIVFTAGSTGIPKPVAHTLSAHVANARGASVNMPLSPGCGWLLSLPLFHVSGLSLLFRSALATSAIVLSDNAPLAMSIRNPAVTHVSVIPQQLQSLLGELNEAPMNLQALLVGGAAAAGSLIETAFGLHWPLHCTYGLSEMASQVTTTRVGAELDELGTSGRILPHRQLKIGADNEILVRGDCLFAGYVDSRNVHRPLRQGWFPTGDIGLLDEGHRLTVLGRKDNMMISGGENIHAEEIENCLVSLDDVSVAVVVPVPDLRFGQRPAAFVASAAWEPDKWKRHLVTQLSKLHVPDHFWPLPDWADGQIKPDRKRLRDEAIRRIA